VVASLEMSPNETELPNGGVSGFSKEMRISVFGVPIR
jgi:hypothetical protein